MDNVHPHPITFAQAINHGLHQSMKSDADVVLLGQDVAKCGGVFRLTEGLLEKFGEERVMDTPLAESGIVGTSVGMALYGLKPIAELQFSGFAYQAFHQIEQHVARYRNRTRGEYPLAMVIRMPYGGGVHAFEHHSESRESYFVHTPGLKVVAPANPKDAYGLLRSAVEDPDPVIYMEPKKLYRSLKDELPPTDYRVPIGEAKVLREGEDLSLISYGSMVPVCLEVVENLQSRVSIELIDLRTLSPLDDATLTKSVEKTGRAVVVHEAPRTLGMGAEISARLVEKAFFSLKAPIGRVTGYDTQMPYYQLEDYYLPDVGRVTQAVMESMQY